jgi:enoyl-CoA hydratase
MGFPENNVGLIPGSGGCSRLVRLVGLSQAKRLVMTGEMVSAERALAVGLVDEIHPAEELLTHAMNFASALAQRAPQALGIAKVVLNQCARVDPDTARNFERLGQSILKKTEDHAEGARAFVEKRRAQFTGR